MDLFRGNFEEKTLSRVILTGTRVQVLYPGTAKNQRVLIILLQYIPGYIPVPVIKFIKCLSVCPRRANLEQNISFSFCPPGGYLVGRKYFFYFNSFLHEVGLGYAFGDRSVTVSCLSLQPPSISEGDATCRFTLGPAQALPYSDLPRAYTPRFPSLHRLSFPVPHLSGATMPLASWQRPRGIHYPRPRRPPAPTIVLFGPPVSFPAEAPCPPCLPDEAERHDASLALARLLVCSRLCR